MPPEHRWMPVLPVVGQLGDVQYLNMYAFRLQCSEIGLRRGHQAVIRSCSFVSGFVDRLCFVKAFVLVFSTPVASPEMKVTYVNTRCHGDVGIVLFVLQMIRGYLSHQECVGDDPAKKILVLFLSIFSPSHSVSFLRAISKPSTISISSNFASPSSNEPYLHVYTGLITYSLIAFGNYVSAF